MKQIYTSSTAPVGTTSISSLPRHHDWPEPGAVSVPEGHTRIAQGFNPGLAFTNDQVPKGRLKRGTLRLPVEPMARTTAFLVFPIPLFELRNSPLYSCSSPSPVATEDSRNALASAASSSGTCTWIPPAANAYPSR